MIEKQDPFYVMCCLRYFAGVSPVARRNVRMKCEWSKNPVSAAMSQMRRSVVDRSVFATLIRTFVMYCDGDCRVSA